MGTWLDIRFHHLGPPETRVRRICQERWPANPAAGLPEDDRVAPVNEEAHPAALVECRCDRADCPSCSARLAAEWLKVLRLLLQLTDFKNQDPLVCSARELSALCARQLGADLPQEEIGNTLQANGFKPRQLGWGDTALRYTLSKAELRHLVERYDPEAILEAKPDQKPQVLEMAAQIAEGENDDANV